MEMIQELPYEVAGGQREAPSEVLEEDYRFSGLGLGQPLTAGRAATQKNFGWDYPTLAQ
jgi:hypothetical protein